MSELSLETLFEAINSLKTEVAGLSSNLRLAEDRIARLEAAAYTPLVSPLPSTEESHQASLSGSRKPSISIEEKPSVPVEEKQSTPTEEKPIASTPKLCSQEGICDIRQHLQPVTDGIAALTDHVLRIERAIGRIPTTCSTSSSETLDKAPTTATNKEFQRILEKAQEKLEISEKPSRNLFEWRNQRKDRESVGTALDASAAASRPIFGQISTPKRREMSVNVTGSPFGSYVDEKSPFSQLAHKNSGQSSVLKPLSSKLDNSKAPISPFSFRASSNECSPGLSKLNLSQPSTSPPSRFTSATFSLDCQPVIFKPSSLNLLRLS